MDNFKTVCVYCGSSEKIDDIYKNAAAALGKILCENGLNLVYGGGRVGLMGIIADSVLRHGGNVTGIIPRHIEQREVAHTGLTTLHVVETMHERKQMMVEKSDAFIILPGGLGTMDEFFEIMTWRQLGLHQKPVVIVNIGGYWDPLEKMLDNIIDRGFARPEDKQFLQIVSTEEDVIAALAKAPREQISPNTKWA